MVQYNAIIIGFGKAGKTLAGNFASKGWKIAMVEQDPKMYGGTCINIACIPTKILIHEALQGTDYTNAINRKNEVVEKLNDKNYQKLDNNDQITVYNSHARFLSDTKVEIKNNGEKETLTSDHIFINTGATPVIPPLKGDISSDKVYTSTTLIEEKELPEQLTIVGGGYIGLEYATMYQEFGSNVTVVTPDNTLLPHEDTEIATAIQKEMEAKGINFLFNSRAETVKDMNASEIGVTLSTGDELTSNAVLLATGRKPNVDGLGLENTSIELTDDNAIHVNDHLETTAANIWALGDVKGGMQFTYVSLDDSRIVMNHLFGEKDYDLETRQNVPYTMFVDPPFSRVGLTASEAKKQGYDIAEGKLEIASHPPAQVGNDLRGIFKVVVDRKTGKILGASLFGPDSHELINLIKLAIDLDTPYTYLRDQVYNHPVMSESFNALFSTT